MVITHLLDTSVYSQPIKPFPNPSVMARWKSLTDPRLSVSVICEAEVLYGLESKQSERLFLDFQRAIQNRLKIWPFDELAAQTFAALKARQKRRGRPIADLDLLIAATAKAHNLALATLDTRHFHEIEGLAVEDWSK